MEKAEISFSGATAADATRLAEDLANFVNSHVDGVIAEVAEGSGETMDFGATVALLLGAPAVVALARGLADWIRRQGDPDLVIKTAKCSVIVKGGLDPATTREVVLAALQKDVA